MRSTLLTSLALSAIVSSIHGGEYNLKLSVGDTAPAWKDLAGTDDKTHSLADFADSPAVLVVFTCNTCPTANDYEDRIEAVKKKYAGKLAVVAINVNTIVGDRLPAMTERATDRKYTYPYLSDPSQKIAKAYGAEYTPEFFVLDKARKVVYMGAMDDKSKASDVRENYLEPAIEAALAGKAAPKGETIARGCRIRWLRESK